MLNEEITLRIEDEREKDWDGKNLVLNKDANVLLMYMEILKDPSKYIFISHIVLNFLYKGGKNLVISSVLLSFCDN